MKFIPIVTDLIRSGVSSIIGFAMPSRCLLCEIPLPFPEQSMMPQVVEAKATAPATATSPLKKHHDSELCESCKSKLVSPDIHYCRRCNFPLNSPADHDYCFSCGSLPFLFRRVIALGQYGNILRELILEIKKDEVGSYARAITLMWLERRRSELSDHFPDLIVPVPSHWQRNMWRGFNQTDVIAQTMAQSLCVPVYYGVQRWGRTPPLWSLTPVERKEVLEDSFRIGGWLPTRKKQRIIGKKILLVDDIVTTGATCNEITRILLRTGAHSVTVACIARSDRREESWNNHYS